MTLFEVIKMRAYPAIAIWASHIVTIGFTTALALLVTFFVGYRLRRLNRKLQSLNINLQQYNQELCSEMLRRQQAESRITHMAHHDALTDLPNRILLEDRINQAIAHAQRAKQLAAVLFIDLDKFKNINDSLGHAVGDQMLQQAAERLRHCVREDDTVARLGGDEFVICLYGLTDKLAALPIADKVLQALNTRFNIAGHELYVSASIGIGIYPADGRNADELLRAADTAMYCAKSIGGDNFQHFRKQVDMHANTQHRYVETNKFH
ncbi:MAG: diguanylate cyclase domain-containing protein [Burkholderiaceae bacterium]